MAVHVVDTGGELPPFWDRSTVFVANLLGLFFGNEEGTRMLQEEVGEVDSYGSRLIPILDLIYRGGENLLVLEREPDADLCGYFGEELGLTLPERRVLRHDGYLELAARLEQEAGLGCLAGGPLADLARRSGGWLDGYVTDDTLARVARRTGMRTVSSPEGSRRGNNKTLLHQHLEAVGLPVMESRIIEKPTELREALRSLAASGFAAAVVKAAVGASGIGMRKVNGLGAGGEELAEVPEHYFFDGPCLVQGWLEPGKRGVGSVRSPSMQLFLHEDAVYLYDVTEQILSHASVHEGNEAPPPYLAEEPALRAELIRQAGEAAGWLHGVGYRGTASADFLVVDRDGESTPEVYVCELNARVTGATYPSVLARHFWPRGSWLMRNLRFGEPLTGQEVLDLLRGDGSLFDPARETPGILPVNFNLGPDGKVHKGQFLCIAQSGRGSHGLLDLARMDLPVAVEPDRD